MMTYTLHKVACSRRFGNWKYDIRDVKDISERAELSYNWVRSATSTLFEAGLNFLTLPVVGERMRFWAFSNQAAGVAGPGSRKSYRI